MDSSTLPSTSSTVAPSTTETVVPAVTTVIPTVSTTVSPAFLASTTVTSTVPAASSVSAVASSVSATVSSAFASTAAASTSGTMFTPVTTPAASSPAVTAAYRADLVPRPATGRASSSGTRGRGRGRGTPAAGRVTFRADESLDPHPDYPETVYESEDDEKFDPLYEQFYGQPYLHYLRSRYSPYSIPAYFKRDHPCDHLLMDNLANLHLPPPLEDEAEYVEEQLIKSLTKEVVTELIWKDTHWMTDTWNRKDLKHLYTAMIESAAHLVYFLYPRDELYRMGRCPDLHYELDQLWAKLREEGRPLDAVWALVVELTSTNNYHLVTEEFIADMLFDYSFSTPSRHKSLFLPLFPVVAEKDKDKLYKDIAEVVKDLEQPPLKPDEYTHWMMTFLRGNALDVELNILSKIMDDRNKLPICFHEPLYPLLHRLLNTAKIRLKQKLLNVVQPLIDICQPVHHETSCVIIEIVEVAELRRIAAGNRFIGRSHLIWAFYKLGYALPLEIKNSIRLDVPDESHPPYHIYMAAAKLALMFGDKSAKLLHFIFAVIHSKDIGFDGQGVTELYFHFKLFKKDCEEMENEIEPKHTVTVRPCRVVDAIIQDIRERYNI